MTEPVEAQYVGAWLSLVERPVRDRKVAGSNPVAPIIKIPFHHLQAKPGENDPLARYPPESSRHKNGALKKFDDLRVAGGTELTKPAKSQ